MRVEKQIDGKTVYVTTINGREVRATTRGGPKAAELMFEIMRAQSGVATSGPMAQDLAPTKPIR